MTHKLKLILKKRIEGQIKTFIKAHPDILLGVPWRHSGTKDEALVNSLTKRILNDLVCDQSVIQIRSSLKFCDDEPVRGNSDL